ncbi:hypothetical protein L1049_027977 [Liquidambar formosana]|uniref:BHLH domain-containing protein n=1 Tax=Liquidambar formosana TaxID=63359 RepID=A0AAP0RI87_LIQFO
MDSEVHVTTDNGADMVAETSVSRSYARKNTKGKVPKKIHKAEREKLKREHLNELFVELENVLGLAQENNVKAFILNEATRLLKDMLTQMECLRKENSSLLSESYYMTMEKNELKDENSALESQIKELQSEVQVRTVQSKPDLNVAPPEFQQPELISHFPEDCLRLPIVEPRLQQPPLAGPVYVIPICNDLQSYREPDAAHLASKPTSNVSKPHPRYPNPGDSWPSQLLGEQS